MVRFVGAYPIWNKVDMIWWLLDGIRQHHKPEEAEWWFLFDDCRDGSREHFDAIAPVVLKGFTYEAWDSPHELREMGCHNAFLDRFSATTAEALVVFQDDQRIDGPGLFGDLDRLSDHYDGQLGYIGGRDGYDHGYANFISSPWVRSDFATDVSPRVIVGEWAERISVNPGPLIYPRHVVERIGKLDSERYKAWYWWDDYAARCREAGFQNFILGTAIEHRFFGRVPITTIHTDKDGWSAMDREAFRQRWGAQW